MDSVINKLPPRFTTQKSRATIEITSHEAQLKRNFSTVSGIIHTYIIGKKTIED